MRRREFVAYGSASLLAAALFESQSKTPAEAQPAASASFELHLEEVYEEMIDGEVLFALACRDPLTGLLRPTLTMTEGAAVQLRIVNRTRWPRRLSISGMPDSAFPVVQPGGVATALFIAPQAGGYIYHDTADGVAGRVAGLHGAMVVLPLNGGRTAAGSATPYPAPSAAQSKLFDALGVSKRFPGRKWEHGNPERTRIWLYNQVDPALNALYERNRPIDPAAVISSFRPRYFTLNGLSGYDSAHDRVTTPKGYVGEPILIRSMNAGLSTHAPHIHGNHVFRLSATSASGGIVKNLNIPEVDTWMMRPMWRVDVLLPMIRPDDIPEMAWPPRQERFPLLYPMHCHMEMSQTAGGGNYPQGLITHWELSGPVRGGTTT